jgi:hypothetical protein
LTAVEATRYHIADSHRIWNEYIAFELLLLEQASTSENVPNVLSIYVERLTTIHMAWDQTFEDFSTFVSGHDNAHYEETMVAVNQQCASVKEAIGEREILESGLVSGWSQSAATAASSVFVYIVSSLVDFLALSHPVFMQVQKNNDLNVFFEYLKKEERARSPSDLLKGLYERAVAIHCTDAGLWEDYVLFEVSRGFGR